MFFVNIHYFFMIILLIFNILTSAPFGAFNIWLHPLTNPQAYIYIQLLYYQTHI